MITTGCGDKGKTGIVGCDDICKSDIRIEVLGTIDEFSAFLGLAKFESSGVVKESLDNIQKELLTVAGCFACGCDFDFEKGTLSIETNMTKFKPDKICPNGFVIYGKTKSGACIDIARAVARRLERNVVMLSEKCSVPNGAIAYFNRMSDYLFVLARFAEKGGN